MRFATVISESDLERELLRKCVGALHARRASCGDCGRTPLVGEHVHIYGEDRVVCELCRPRRRGRPQRSEPVQLAGRGQTVRLLRAA